MFIPDDVYNAILLRLSALEIQPEKVPFVDANGTFNIDFTVNLRNTKYLPQKALPYYVIDGIDVLVDGYSVLISPSIGLVTNVQFDGLFGSGYVLLSR